MRTNLAATALLVAGYGLGLLHGRWAFGSEPAPAVTGMAPQEQTLTDSLVKDFHDAWNAEDVAGMVKRLRPSVFLRSPFQLRYGRDEMAETVLRTNPPVFKNVTSTETHSSVSGNLAWSIASLESDVYDGMGTRTGEHFDADYLFVFTRGQDGVWKVQMLVYHELCD